MLARTSLKEQMLAWLDGKDPSKHYEWNSLTECACGQFAKSIGRFEEWRNHARGDIPVGKNSQKWEELNHIARGDIYIDYIGQRWTFGEMRDRLLEDLSRHRGSGAKQKVNR